MARLGNYNPGHYDPAQTFDLLDPGWYAMQIIESDMVTTKNGRGQMLVLTFEIIEAQHPKLKGRRVWDRLNLQNDNAQTVDIANRTLSAICHSIGHLGELPDSEALHQRPMAVKVGTKPAEGEYDASNKVKGYDPVAVRFPAGGPSTQPIAQPAAAAAPAAQAAAPVAQAVTPPAAAAAPAAGQPNTGKAPWQQPGQ